MTLARTHFFYSDILDASSLDKSSYEYLESKLPHRHLRSIMMNKKLRDRHEVSPRGFKPTQTFRRDGALNPLDYAPSVVKHPELDPKLKQFYKVKARKHSINKPIDASESFLASGGPSNHFVTARENKRLSFVVNKRDMSNPRATQGPFAST